MRNDVKGGVEVMARTASAPRSQRPYGVQVSPPKESSLVVPSHARRIVMP